MTKISGAFFQKAKIFLSEVFQKARSGFFVFLKKHGLLDPFLAFALFAGFCLGLQGLTWGRYDCMNLDKMAFRQVLSKDRPLLHPGGFLKPPFYTYATHFLAKVPAQTFASNLFFLDKETRWELYLRLRLSLARVLNMLLFASTTLFLFGMIRSFFGVFSARTASLLWATSAGLLPFQIFLTTDLPVVFMMLAAFVFAVQIAREPTMRASVLAGLLTGLAAATKYNGLVVAVALPVAQLMGSRGNPFWASFKRPAAWVCGLVVPVGFILGNPYSVLDWKGFWQDFRYNYVTAPVYGGEDPTLYGYRRFFELFGEIFGLPGCLLLLVGVVFGAVVIWRGRKEGDAWKLWLLALAVFVVYTGKMGAFPRVETRFVLPVAAFLLLLAAPGFFVFSRVKVLFVPVFGLLLVYNIGCGIVVGGLFRNDPRMRAMQILMEAPEQKMRVELSRSLQSIRYYPWKEIKVDVHPLGIERSENFSKLFSGEEGVEASVKRIEQKETKEWYSFESRAQRNPDWIAWTTGELEEIVKPYHEALFSGGSGYELVYDAASDPIPWWAYPSGADFMKGRTSVWRRERVSGE